MKPISAIYIHVGFEKTGSTSLFNTLGASREGLARHGVLFPDIENVHKALPLALGADTPARRRRLGLTDSAEVAVSASNTLASLAQQIATFEGDTVVISAEMLGNLDPEPLETLRGILASYAEAVKVVAYVRHPVAHAVSLCQQRIKTGGSTRLEMEARPRRRPYLRRLRTHIRVFGLDNVVVRPFETKRLFGGRVQPDFLHTIGFKGPAEALTTVDGNSSLTMPGVVLADLMNQHSGKRFKTGNFIFDVPGGRYSLPAAALDFVAEEGREDIEFLRDRFGIEFAAPLIEPRAPIDSYFSDDVLAAIEAVPANVQLSRKVLPAFDAALKAIRSGSFDEVTTIRRRLRRLREGSPERPGRKARAARKAASAVDA